MKRVDQVYDLIEEMGGDVTRPGLVLDELIRFLPAATVERFISCFRTNHDLPALEAEHTGPTYQGLTVYK
jgi:hypothetical protein|tara:strand:+ start:536 stop:745 length:210 start_codon:yes stop_codon:yes gene_type:complete